MTRIVPAALAAALLVSAGAGIARAADCKAELEAAFEKQRTHAPGYHVDTEQYQDTGIVKVALDYALPDRMYQSIKPADDKNAIETIAVARWAWGNMGGGWEELQPQFAQAVSADVAATLGQPVKASGAFECLGKIAYEGHDYLGYRSTPSAPAQPEPAKADVARTVYVDPATGLPVVNLVGEVKAGGKLWAKSVFSYPASIAIEAPVGAAPAKPGR